MRKYFYNFHFPTKGEMILVSHIQHIYSNQQMEMSPIGSCSGDLACLLAAGAFASDLIMKALISSMD
jgi:hypothetical protein